jgi:tRNA (cmo5U34)-methyltransferase
MSPGKRHQDEAAVRDEVEAIRNGLPHSAPPRPGQELPTWMSEGIEGLPEFFNAAARLWDARFGEDPDNPFLTAVASPIRPTEAAISILDIGCGTGLELPAIFDRAPNARITGIDQAPNMLKELRRKFRCRMGQITLTEGSCLDVPFGTRVFDYVVSRLTMHHFAIPTKRGLYRRIREALKPGGCYIEGDQSASPEFERQVLRWYEDYIAQLPDGDLGRWNFDVTLSTDTQRRLLREAGFSSVELVAEHRNANGNGWAVFAATP